MYLDIYRKNALLKEFVGNVDNFNINIGKEKEMSQWAVEYGG